ncbi:MAG TPA: FUSC family protein, partial [Phnomibacter sp.]|nr:FUSC family protein [Phnomibacter sp.]
TRSIIKESTHTGRVLVMAFLETVDLFETILTSEQDYRHLQRDLGALELLPTFGASLRQLSESILETGIAIQESRAAKPNDALRADLTALEKTYETFRQGHMNAKNADAFNGLRSVINGIKDVADRVEQLQTYSTYDRKLKQGSKIDLERFVVPSYINGRLLIENLNHRSNIFRYSIRMSLAVLSGFALSLFLPVGHSYWILLTLVVILKPAYALTRQRNIERLGGTILGSIAGVIVLVSTSDKLLLLIILILSMTGAFSLMRLRYWLSVSLLTLYVLVAFYLLQPGDYTLVFKDRLLDTFIGSIIALVFTRIIPPIWEKVQIKELLAAAVDANRVYFRYIADGFTGQTIDTSTYKWYRKETYVTLANLSDAFQRMLNEPKSRQQPGEYMHPLIVSCHVLASRIATLSGYSRMYPRIVKHSGLHALIGWGEQQLLAAKAIIENGNNPLKTKNPAWPGELWREIQTTKQIEWQNDLQQADAEWNMKMMKTVMVQMEAILKLTADILSLAQKMHKAT